MSEDVGRGRAQGTAVMLRISGKGITAEGYQVPGGFVVVRHSQAVGDVASHLTQAYRRLRRKLLTEGTLATAGDHIEFTRDSVFTSPSTAATIVLGRSANGRIEWKDSTGRTLAELQPTAEDAPESADGLDAGAADGTTGWRRPASRLQGKREEREMPHGDVTGAFDLLLLGELQDAVDDVTAAGSDAFQRGDFDEASGIAQRAKVLTGFLDEMRDRAKYWRETLGNPGTLSDGEPRPAPQTKRRRKRRLPRGLRTPQDAFRLPILRVLVELGGEGSTSAVLDRVYRHVEGRLCAQDMEQLSPPHEMPRWRNTASWERAEMVKEGLLRDDSPRGVWAISERGREYLRERDTTPLPGSSRAGDVPPAARFTGAITVSSARQVSELGDPDTRTEDDEKDPEDAMNDFLQSGAQDS